MPTEVWRALWVELSLSVGKPHMEVVGRDGEGWGAGRAPFKSIVAKPE